MKHKKEWITCDRCGKEVKIPDYKKCIDAITPRLVRLKFEKPIRFEEVITEIHQHIRIPEKSLEQIDCITFREYYHDRVNKIDLCPKCRKDFERFMKNEKL